MRDQPNRLPHRKRSAKTVRTKEAMDRIGEFTAKKARDNILHQRPQIDELLEAAKLRGS